MYCNFNATKRIIATLYLGVDRVKLAIVGITALRSTP